MGTRQNRENVKLNRIKEILEQVDVRCMAVDGPVTPGNEEITLQELQMIYALACGKPENWRPSSVSRDRDGREVKVVRLMEKAQ